MQILNCKKAAMFGLDARIALAIFGALSVITGAALYSAIQQSKIVTMVTRATETIKAYEAYLLDVGSPIRKIGEIDAGHANKSFALYATDLVVNPGFSGWKGPYLTIRNLSDTQFSGRGFVHSLMRADTGTWGGAVVTPVCSAQKTCNFWVAVWTESEDIAKKIDILVDGSDTPDSGKIRIRDDSKHIAYYNSGIKYTNM